MARSEPRQLDAVRTSKIMFALRHEMPGALFTPFTLPAGIPWEGELAHAKCILAFQVEARGRKKVITSHIPDESIFQNLPRFVAWINDLRTEIERSLNGSSILRV